MVDLCREVDVPVSQGTLESIREDPIMVQESNFALRTSGAYATG